MLFTAGDKNFRVGGLTSEINVTPMADIMLVLLIIFMITTPMLQEGIYVNMARAEFPKVSPGAREKDSITVALTRDDRVYLNNTETTMQDLEGQMAGMVALAPGQPVFVKGDVAVRYGRVVEVLDISKRVGIDRVAILVEHEDKVTLPSAQGVSF